MAGKEENVPTVPNRRRARMEREAGRVKKDRKGLGWEGKAAAAAAEEAYASGKGLRQVRAEVEDGVYREFKSLAASRGQTVKRAIGLVLAQEVDRAFEVRVRSWQAKLNVGLGAGRPVPDSRAAAREDPVLVPTAERLEAPLDEHKAWLLEHHRAVKEGGDPAQGRPVLGDPGTYDPEGRLGKVDAEGAAGPKKES